MSGAVAGAPPGRATLFMGRAGAGLAVLLPVLLLLGRGPADIAFVLLDLLFLLHTALTRDWSWTRTRWVWFGAAWWAWLVLTAAPHGAEPLGQALAIGRFLLLVAALEHWAFRDPAVRRWTMTLLRACAAYIAFQCVVQLSFGRNLFGFPRGADGELTGPFKNPRAGAPLARMLLPSVLPYVGRIWGVPLLLGGCALMVLIGQRMALLHTLLGLVVTALLLPRLRPAVLAAAAAAGLLLATSSVVSPPAFHRLVTKFSAQMEDFPHSHYGQIAARAVAIAAAHPLAGDGFDAFKRDCDDPAFFQGWGGGDGGGAAICVQHPHNFYLQALDESGIPGLALFSFLIIAWLLRLSRGLWHEPDPLRVALFAAALMHFWPIASMNDLASMPLSGWSFLLLGLGLAETRAYIEGRPSPQLTQARP